MSNDATNLLLRLNADGNNARREAAATRQAIVEQMRQAAQEINAVGSQTANNESFDALFRQLTQFRIGLTQIARGDLGGIPNLIQGFRLTSDAIADIQPRAARTAEVMRLLDAAVVDSGTRFNSARSIFEQFTLALERAGSEPETLRALVGVGAEIEKDLARPEPAFRQILLNLNALGANSQQSQAFFRALGLESQRLQQRIISAARSLETFEQAEGAAATAAGGLSRSAIIAGGALIAVEAAAIGAIAAMFALANRFADVGDEIQKIQDRTNLSAKSIQELSAAARIANVDFEDVTRAISTFQDKVADAEQGNQRLKNIFRELGVDIQAAAANPEAAFEQLISTLEDVSDQSLRTALAKEVLGTSAEGLIRVINRLNDNNGELRKNLEATGAVMSGESLEASRELNAQWEQTKIALEGAANTLGNLFIPIIREAAEWIKDASEKSAEFLRIMLAINGLSLEGPATNADGGLNWNGEESPFADDKQTEKAERFRKALQQIRQKNRSDEDKEASARLRTLEAQLRDEEQLYQDTTKRIERRFDERMLSEETFTAELRFAVAERLRQEKAILDEERAAVEASKFSPARKEQELERIATRRKAIERQTQSEIEQIQFDSNKRIQQAFEELQQETLRGSQILAERRTAAIREALELGVIAETEGERRITEVMLAEIDERIRLAQAEVSRAGLNIEQQAIANQRLRNLEQEKTAIVEDGVRRRDAARRRELDQQRQYEREILQIQQQAREARQRIAETFVLNREQAIADRAAIERDSVNAEINEKRRALEEELKINNESKLDDLDTQQQKLNNRIRITQQIIELENLRRARIAEIDRQEKVDQETNRPNSDRNVLGAETSETFERLNESLGRQATFFERLRAEAGRYVQQVKTEMITANQAAQLSFGSLGQAMGNAIGVYVKSGGNLRAAGAALYQSLTAPWIEYALFKAKLHAAEAIAAFARLDFATGSLHLLAAGGFAALAAGGVALGNAISGSSGGGGASSAVAPTLTGTRQDENSRSFEDRFRFRETGPDQFSTEIVIRHETGMFVEKVSRAVKADYENDGLTRQVIRKETTGEPVE